MVKRVIVVLFLLLNLLVIFSSKADSIDKKGFIESFLGFAKGLRYVEGSFVQTFISGITGKKKLMQGRFFAIIPGHFRWDYTLPEKKSMGTDGKKAWIYRPKDRVLMILADAKRFIDKSALAVLFGNKDIDRYFEMSITKRGTILLTSKSMGNILKIEVSYDKSKRTIKEVSYIDKYGNKNSFRFSDMKLEHKIDPEVFCVPDVKGVEVIER